MYLIFPGMLEKPLYREAEYYGILDHVKAARKGPLNGNRLECVASMSGRATGDGTAIRASPDGGCCVAHGSMVHVYDWLLEEQIPLTLDYVNVNDVGFLSPNRVVICTSERGERAGGMASFNIKTGKIEHKFQVCRILKLVFSLWRKSLNFSCCAEQSPKHYESELLRWVSVIHSSQVYQWGSLFRANSSSHFINHKKAAVFLLLISFFIVRSLCLFIVLHLLFHSACNPL